MGSYTTPKTTVAIPLTSTYKTILTKIPVIGDSGEPIGIKFYANISGLWLPGLQYPYGVVLDVRFLRNSITDENDPDFDETGLDTYNPNARYKDKTTGEPYWKQYVAQPWGFSKNCTNVAVQVRCYNAKNPAIKAGAFAGTTDYDQ